MTKKVNVQKGKQGFQETAKSASETSISGLDQDFVEPYDPAMVDGVYDPTLDPNSGSFNEEKAGLKQYADAMKYARRDILEAEAAGDEGELEAARTRMACYARASVAQNLKNFHPKAHSAVVILSADETSADVWVIDENRVRLVEAGALATHILRDSQADPRTLRIIAEDGSFQPWQALNKGMFAISMRRRNDGKDF
jgi:hypothetical protein